jgi:hypothetical protein
MTSSRHARHPSHRQPGQRATLFIDPSDEQVPSVQIAVEIEDTR